LGGCQAVIAGTPPAASRLLQRTWYIRENQVGCQAAIASKPAPTRAWYIRENQVGSQAVIAGKPAPTKGVVHPRESGR